MIPSKSPFRDMDAYFSQRSFPQGDYFYNRLDRSATLVIVYIRTIQAMLRNYANDHQNDWDCYVSALTYSYNCHVHRSAKTTPFNLVLS